MKIEELKALFEQHSTEEGTDYEKLNEAINADIDAVLDRKKAKMMEAAKGETLESFLKEQGFDNFDSYTAFVKNSKATATEVTEKATRLEQELAAERKRMADYEAKVKQFETEKQISALGISAEFGDYAMYKINQMVNDEVTFEEAAKKFVADNQHILDAKGLPDMRQPKPKEFDNPIMDEVERKFMERNPNLKV